MPETQCADGAPKSPWATERPWATVVPGVPCGWLIMPAEGAHRCSGDEDRITNAWEAGGMQTWCLIRAVVGGMGGLIVQTLWREASWGQCTIRHVREGAGNVTQGRTRHPLHDRKRGEWKLPAHSRTRLGSTRPDVAATPKCEVKRHGASGHSNECLPVPPDGYSASHFAGSAIYFTHCST